MLLYWKLQGRILDMADWDVDFAVQQLNSCWLLGEKHDIRTLQNVVMIRLLHAMVNWRPTAPVLKFVLRNTKPASKLCLLMAQETVRQLHSTGEDSLVSETELCEGPKEFMAVILRAMTTTCSDEPHQWLDAQERWRDHMVAGDPDQH